MEAMRADELDIHTLEDHPVLSFALLNSGARDAPKHTGSALTGNFPGRDAEAGRNRHGADLLGGVFLVCIWHVQCFQGHRHLTCGVGSFR